SSATVQADGKIIIGGNFIAPRSCIARVNADGTLDASFNAGANSYVLSMAVQADAKSVVGGQFTVVSGVGRNCIARLNVDGTADSGFDPDVRGGTSSFPASVNSIMIQADGKIIIGGTFTTIGGTARNNLARLNADGSLDTGFNPNVSVSNR